jgi:hypothetical protein
MWGRPAPPAGRLAPVGPTYHPCCYVGFSPPPKVHLRRFLSRFDPRAHVASSELYKQTPFPPEASSH